MVYGFKKSKIDGTELEFKEKNGLRVPKTYSYVKYLPDVLNQGSKPICVPCSCSAFINWKLNIDNGNNTINNNVNLDSIYKSRTNDSNDGMTFKDAFYFLRHNGVKTDMGIIKIGRYAKLGSIVQLKQAILVNGPCFGALPVYETNRDDFWNKETGGNFLGGHAVSIIGWDEEGFIIRNSWGKSFGDYGYTVLPYDDFSSFLELWTVID